jgi:hypothetical protein
MAKKSKGFAELLQQKREGEIEQRGMNKLRQKLQDSPFGKTIGGIVTNPEGEVKMSEVLEKFVEPYLDTAKSSSDRRSLIGIAVTAWNLALMPENERQSFIDKFIVEMFNQKDTHIIQDIREILDEMVARKLEFFPDVKRLIVEFQLQETRNKFHLSVASTLTESSIPAKPQS